MSLLKPAVAGRVPLIRVTTDDPVYAPDIVEKITGVKPRIVVMNPNELLQGVPDWVSQGSLFICSGIPPNAGAKLYKVLKATGKTLIVVSDQLDPSCFNAGVLSPTEEHVQDFLVFEKIPKDLRDVLSGLTMSGMSSVAAIAKEEEDLSVQGILSVRSRLKQPPGLHPVQMKEEVYVPPSDLCEWTAQEAMFFLKDVHPALMPRGLLLDGLQGTGKTSAARYIARTWGLPLYRIDIQGMKGRYVGDSEGALERALNQVDQLAPCIVLLDETEKAFGAVSDSGVTASMMGQLLWWLQEHKTKVLSVLTTNKKAALPPELYRKGRVDKVFEFHGLASIAEAIKLGKLVLHSILKDIDMEVPQMEEAIQANVAKELHMMFTSNQTVPQVDVIDLIHRSLKTVLKEVYNNASL